MNTFREEGLTEYASLTNWAQGAERTSQLCWIGAMVAAVTILAWGTVSQSCALMLPVIVSVAVGFYASLRGRQQVCSIAAYVEEHFEGQGSETNGFARLVHFRTSPGFNPVGDWMTAFLAVGVALVAVVFAWLFAGTAWRGELMAGIVTACGIVFAFHAIAETSRLPRAEATANPHRASVGSREVPRRDRVVGE